MKTIIAISTKEGDEKATFLIEILSLLQMDDFVVKGFVVLQNFGTDSYIIKNVETNEQSVILEKEDESIPRSYKISPEGESQALNWIEDALEHPPHITIIDEMDGYESQSKLWSDGFAKLLETDTPLIFTVKDKHLHEVTEKWNISPKIILDSDDFDDPHGAIEKVMEWIKPTQK